MADILLTSFFDWASLIDSDFKWSQLKDAPLKYKLDHETYLIREEGQVQQILIGNLSICGSL